MTSLPKWACTVVLVAAALPAAAQSLFNNAVKAGLVGEGLKTRTRPGGGWYSEVQYGNGTAAYSFRQVAGNILADDFDVDGSGWRIQGVTIWGFQPNAHSPTISSGIVEVRASSHLGPKVASGVWESSVMTEIYRIFNNRPEDTYQCQKVAFRMNAFLPPGHYWLLFSGMGIPNWDGPWCPNLTKVGELTVPGANAMGRGAFASLIWIDLADAGSHLPQDLPFWIDGYRLGPNTGTPAGPPPEPLDLILGPQP